MATLAQCLIDTLNPDANTRIAAELRLSELFLDPGRFSEVRRRRVLTPHVSHADQSGHYLYINIRGRVSKTDECCNAFRRCNILTRCPFILSRCGVREIHFRKVVPIFLEF